MMAGFWEVFMDGKFLGIVESDYLLAVKYWQDRAFATGRVYKLKERI